MIQQHAHCPHCGLVCHNSLDERGPICPADPDGSKEAARLARVCWVCEDPTRETRDVGDGSVHQRVCWTCKPTPRPAAQSTMSVPRPAMFVATVLPPTLTAWLQGAKTWQERELRVRHDTLFLVSLHVMETGCRPHPDNVSDAEYERVVGKGGWFFYENALDGGDLDKSDDWTPGCTVLVYDKEGDCVREIPNAMPPLPSRRVAGAEGDTLDVALDHLADNHAEFGDRGDL